MARLLRYELADMPQHVIERGNNRQATYFGDADDHFYLECLADAAKYYGCDIPVGVLITNHVHLLITPRKPHAILDAAELEVIRASANQKAFNSSTIARPCFLALGQNHLPPLQPISL